MAKSKETQNSVSTKSPPVPSKAEGSKSLFKYYLIAYNALSALGWAYILLLTLIHLFAPSPHSSSSPFSRLLPFIMSWTKPRIKPVFSPIEAYLPKLLLPVFRRTTTVYTQVGHPTAVVQSAAVLEIIHVIAGFVRSPFQTTAMQVSSRLFLVWGVVEQYPSVRANPLYASMIFAWSLTEVIRYSFYAFSLTAPAYPPPKFLTILRYTTFYVLYPLGAGSEAFINYFSLPNSSPLEGKWSFYDYFRGAMFLVWWPGLYVMYTHMIKQRRKVFNAPKSKTS
ncbi:PTPLA-domain-containing protein [Marasmius fiardii PR-910]|nr:PTPLA-domain-containing protein [Marasmius fiardii PR-910]